MTNASLDQSALSLRQRFITAPLLRKLQSLMPPISDTERQALEAGGVWWDAELLSGKPNWDCLLGMGKPELSSEEQAFIDGPVAELCGMIDDWAIFEARDIPPEIWRFLKLHKFFGMIIPKRYGGLEFSAFAHSEVVTRISTCSTTVAVTVMVPNSLGPGELLLKFGTEAQRNYYLPRLADGRDIPCFGLTSPEAGSDAGAMVDKGVVCYGEYTSGPHKGKRVLGMRVNWHKRYITLGPVATLLGLAFKLYDPDHLLGQQEELGITVALVPTSTPGVTIGERHYPAAQAFQNGPNWGKDVFIPMEWIIGGQEQIGQGWQMLMSALAAGRSISLPSLATGGAKLAARTSGAYARIREQFHLPIAKFEGIQECLARMSANAYLLDAARKTTTLALDQGKVPAVISAILKAHATYRLRESINDAMDLHGGKAICDGPNNYLGNSYRAVPVAITVEGANILTRSLIIFGQGAIRCHPYLLEEMKAAEDPDATQAVKRFDKVIFKHLGFQVRGFFRAWFSTWTGGVLAAAPSSAAELKPHYQQINRYAATLTFATEVALLSLGGALKRKEFISARLGDVLSELYLLSCMLKHFDDDGRPSGDRPLVDWCMETGLRRIEQRLEQVIQNFPVRPAAWLMKVVLQPLGARRRTPSDQLTKLCADLLTRPSHTRRRLTGDVYQGRPGFGIALLEEAFDQVVATEALREKMRRNHLDSIDTALAKAVITDIEAQRLRSADAAVARAIKVDHFEPEYLSGEQAKPSTHRSIRVEE